jgi:predicted permease
MANLRTILRGLAHSPWFTFAAILSLALGIGANTAIFSLIDQILLRTLPVRNPEELVNLYSQGPWQGSMSSDESGGPSFSYPLFRELQQELAKPDSGFAGLAGARSQLGSLAYRNSAQLGSVRLVSGNYFSLLGVRPALGRLLTDDDDRTPGAHSVAVLNHTYWISRFGGDPGLLNQPMLVNGLPMTIVGVAQQGFLSERLGGPPDIYVPISMREAITPDWKGLANRQDAWVTMFARRRPGVTLERAQAEINVPYRAQVERDAQLMRQPRADFLQRFRDRRMTLKSGEHGRGDLHNEAREPLLLLIGITAMVLLIACANVANLQLARSATRTREVAVRLAIGASRAQLVRQLLAESCILAVAGGALGLLFAYGTIRASLAALPASTGMAGFLSATLDGRVLLFSLALSVATGLGFGLFPALHATRPDLATSLKDQAGQISSTRSANAFRKALVTVQVAVALLLLVSGGLFARTLVNLTRIELGIKTDHLLTFAVMPKLNQYTDARVAQFYQQLTERLRAIPGVTLVSASQIPAIAGSNASTSITVEGYTPQSFDDANASFNAVGADYFRTMGTALAAGREFTEADNAAGPKVVIVNQAFAKKFLPDQNPLGRHMRRGGGARPGPLELEIVGVVTDARYSQMRDPAPPVYYTPLAQNERWGQLFFYVRTSIPPANAAPLLQRAVAEIDPNLPLRELKTMQRQIEENLFEERIMSTLTASFAGLATLLAAVGLYGVLAYNIARRTREIGIRMALGAGARKVRALVVREVAWMLGLGTVAGVTGAAAGGKLVQSMLYGMQPWDALVYGSAVALLWLVALAAAYVPASRATRVHPMIALRYE